MQSIIYYGGSFNPPHLSHLLFVVALKAFYPDAEILVAPTFSHAFHKSLLPYETRLEMLHAAFKDFSGITITTIERDLHESTSYTVDVVRALADQYPGIPIHIAVGADIVPTLPQWHEYENLRKIASFLIFPREGYDCSQAIPMPHLPEISSSDIREKIALGRWDDVKKLVPAAVYDILKSSECCQN